MDRFLEKISAYPLSHKVLFLLGVMLAIFGGFWMMLYTPIQEKIESSKAQVIDLERQKQSFENQQSAREAALVQLEQYRTELRIRRDSLPETAEISSLLRIQNQAKTAGLEILKFKHNPEVRRDYYIEIPVDIELVGTYDELANFFFYVGRMTRIVNIRDVSMKLQSRAGSDGRLVVAARVTTFRYVPK